MHNKERIRYGISPNQGEGSLGMKTKPPFTNTCPMRDFPCVLWRMVCSFSKGSFNPGERSCCCKILWFPFSKGQQRFPYAWLWRMVWSSQMGNEPIRVDILLFCGSPVQRGTQPSYCKFGFSEQAVRDTHKKWPESSCFSPHTLLSYIA